jgi:hypothetical protein
MLRETKSRAAVAALIYTMTNAVIFGIGLITVLTLPALRDEEVIWIPVVVVASLILAAPAAWVIAPRLRARYWRQRAAERPPATVLPRI